MIANLPLGSYLAFTICHSTSLYITLRNNVENDGSDITVDKLDTTQIFVQPTRQQAPPSAPVSLLVQIDSQQELYFNQTGHGTLAISSALDARTCHDIRLTYLGNGADQIGTLEFEGIWLTNRGYALSESSSQHESKLSDEQDFLRRLPSVPRKHFEVIHRMGLYFPDLVLNSWPLILAQQTTTIHSVFSTSSHHLATTTLPSKPTIADVYFRSGPPDTPYYQIPYRFKPPYPSALILDIGLLDYTTFLSTKPSAHATQQFTAKFIKAYVDFIRLIRSTAYPSHSSYTFPQQGPILNADASFTYNSAPSTLPIFLLTPFTPSKRLQRLLSHALSQAVSRLQADGDKSTFWIDTSGWLTTKDFLDTHNDNSSTAEATESVLETLDNNLDAAPPALTTTAHGKIAAYLSSYLCPYLTTEPIPVIPWNDTMATSLPALILSKMRDENGCPFNKMDNYMGNLYIPEESGMGAMMAERKIELVKSSLSMETAFL